jgi:hypothetical protein
LTLEQALAVLTIAGFLLFVAWGRTRSGRQTLISVFGEPAPTRRPAARKPEAG